MLLCAKESKTDRLFQREKEEMYQKLTNGLKGSKKSQTVFHSCPGVSGRDWALVKETANPASEGAHTCQMSQMQIQDLVTKWLSHAEQVSRRGKSSSFSLDNTHDG